MLAASLYANAAHSRYTRHLVAQSVPDAMPADLENAISGASLAPVVPTTLSLKLSSTPSSPSHTASFGYGRNSATSRALRCRPTGADMFSSLATLAWQARSLPLKCINRGQLPLPEWQTSSWCCCPPCSLAAQNRSAWTASPNLGPARHRNPA